MHDSEGQRTVFVSYSHKDEPWKDKLRPHLQMLEKAGRVVLWDDRMIDGGATWFPRITEAMEKARVAVCLISQNYLSSDFVQKEEIPFFLKKREEEGMLLLPVLIHRCTWKVFRWLKDIQMIPRDNKSIAEDFVGKEDVAFEMVGDEILNFLDKPQPKAAPIVVSTWPKPAESCVDTGRLPGTSDVLFGRSKELDLLDEAWKSRKISVLSFVAWGGVGKSALVNKWVAEMAADNYRGAKRVFAWSFYSQGTGERVTTADPFIDFALRWFGDEKTANSAMSAWDKGARLAELVQEEPTLLLLDGMEPLQSGWDHDKGRINDPGLAALVKHLARKNPGLCVVTTRLPVADLEVYKDRTEEIDLMQISDEAGRALLRAGGIRGTDAELEQVTRDFGNHALAVGLLVSYLSGIPKHHVSGAKSIPDLPEIAVDDGKHPRRVMEAFAKRFGESPELDVLRMMGLFDRPALAEEIEAVKGDGAIVGLTEHIHRTSKAGWRRLLDYVLGNRDRISKTDWERVLDSLRGKKLIAHESRHNPGALDAHPLVREHFGAQLRKENEEAWKEANNRLYEYYKSLPKKRFPDTIEEMVPLFQAVIHGCRAGRHQKALEAVYWPRIKRGDEFYSSRKLGAFGNELSALADFFDPPWSSPVKTLTPPDQSFVLNEAAVDLRALNRLADAIEPMKASLEAVVAQEDWRNAAQDETNLSELSLTIGDVDGAVKYAEESVRYADKSKDAFLRMAFRTTHADALQQAGRIEEAEKLFREAERIQKKWQPEYPLLYSLPGFRFCDLLLAKGEHQEAQRRATQTLEWVTTVNWLLDIALDHLTLGRTRLMGAGKEGTNDFREAVTHLNQAVDGLRSAAYNEFIARGLIARAELYRVTQDFTHAQRDLDDAYEIAHRGGMKLFECDIHLECARLLQAMTAAGKPLDPNNVPPDSPLAKFQTPQDHVNYAATLVKETGYHRRDKDIKALRIL